MIQLTPEEKQFINTKLKPFLKKDDWDKIRRECQSRKNILAFFAENGLNVFSGLTKARMDIVSSTEISRIIIPKEIKIIGTNTFYDCANLTSITFEEGVEEIESRAFNECGIVQIVLPESLIKLNREAFTDCKNLKSVTLPNSITILPDNLFEGCPDNIEIYAQSRKDLPKNQKLRCPKTEIDWYVDHLKVLELE